MECFCFCFKLLAEDAFDALTPVICSWHVRFLLPPSPGNINGSCPEGLFWCTVSLHRSFFSLYLLKSSVINLFKPSGDGGRKLTLITRSERGLIIIDTNISVVHRTEYRIASSCVAQKTASSKASFCSVERSKDCNQTALSNVTLAVHLLFPLLHL